MEESNLKGLSGRFCLQGIFGKLKSFQPKANRSQSQGNCFFHSRVGQPRFERSRTSRLLWWDRADLSHPTSLKRDKAIALDGYAIASEIQVDSGSI